MAAHSCSGVLLALNLVLTNDPLGSRNDVKSTDTIISEHFERLQTQTLATFQNFTELKARGL